MADGGGVRPSLTGGVKLVAAASEEMWQRTTFPLLLCDDCQSRFQSDHRLGRAKGVLKLVGLLGLLIAFLYFAFNNAELVAAFSGIIWLIGAIAWAAQFRQSTKAPSFLLKWISNIRWVPDIIDREDEFELTIGTTTAITAS